MLSKDKRLNLKTDFKWVASGKKLESHYLKLFFKSGDNQLPRVGIAVSSKSFKKATDRNRARRLVSAALEKLYPDMLHDINIVALPKAGVLSVKSGDIVLDLEAILKHEKIIN